MNVFVSLSLTINDNNVKYFLKINEKNKRMVFLQGIGRIG